MHADRFPQLAVLAGSVIAALALTSAHAAIIIVDGVTCKLSDAIVAANNDSTVAGSGCSAGSGDDVLQIAGNQTLSGELPAITTNIALTNSLPPPGTTTINGDGTHRLFYVGALGVTPTVSFSALTLSGGKATGGAGVDGGGGGAGLGGALFIASGNVTVSNVVFQSNHAAGGNSTGLPTIFGSNVGTGGGGGGGMGGNGGTAAASATLSGGQGASMAFGSGGGGGGRVDFELGGGSGGSGGFDGGGGGGPGNPANAGGNGEYGGGGGGGGGGVMSPSASGGSGGFGGGGGGGGGNCVNGSSCGTASGTGGVGGFGGGGGAAGSFAGQPPSIGGNGGFGGGGGADGFGEGGGSSYGRGGFGGGNASSESGGGGAGFGGAVFIRSGSFDVHNSTFTSNGASRGAATAFSGIGKGGAIAALTVLDNGNGNNPSMPTALPRVTGCANTFSSNSADDAGTLPRDNGDTFGADQPGLQLACNDRVFADGFGSP